MNNQRMQTFFFIAIDRPLFLYKRPDGGGTHTKRRKKQPVGGPHLIQVFPLSSVFFFTSLSLLSFLLSQQKKNFFFFSLSFTLLLSLFYKNNNNNNNHNIINKTSIMLSEEENYALLLSTLAGLSTSVGGVLAVWKRPDAKLLAFLLGTAIGVMATLSFVELYVKNVLENGFWGVTLSTMAGAVLYAIVEPLLPHVDLFEKDGPGGTKQKQNGGGSGGSGGGKVKSSESNTSSSLSKSMSSSMSSAMNERGNPVPGETEASRGRLMRLGILMAVAMTLHNIPEGFAVAFSSFTEIGPIMAIAIGLHNVPEGIIVAAPVYAATGSRRKALALATASGLSEPLGALFALFFIQPYLTPLRLQYMLAATGGVMSAVCFIELWPEGKKCKNDLSLAKGVILGSALMLGTLYVGV